MARQLTLTRYGVTNESQFYLGVFRLKVDVVGSGGMDGRVFLFQRKPYNAYLEAEEDIFLTVCSPVDMTDYPPDAPDDDKKPFFRKSSVTLDLRSTEDLDYAYTTIKSLCDQLVSAMDRLDTLNVVAVDTVGEETEGSVSESVSESVSLS